LWPLDVVGVCVFLIFRGNLCLLFFSWGLGFLPWPFIFWVAGVTDRRGDAGAGLLVASGGRRIAAGLLHI
ncbi:hypothetical protein, partial [Salmonella enterica]|uniref:hypothetical protein n=1 Tax=Salmonella enterica TaxID=28901 RepID=UPI00398C3E28